MPKKSNSVSELRCDPVSGDWVVVAAARAMRPDTFKVGVKKKSDKVACPFCVYFQASAENTPHARRSGVYFKKQHSLSGSIVVIPNKFPAFSKMVRGQTPYQNSGLFKRKPAVGFHEIVITNSHHRQIADFSVDAVQELLNVYQERYLALCKEKSVDYVFIFHNHGQTAGASITHPHSQIIASQDVDCSFLQPLKCAQKFYQEKKQCVYCQIVKAEIKNKSRVVFENKNFVAICPFASKIAFEVMILPKKHSPYFEKITDEEKQDLAKALQTILAKIKKSLNNPDYNFYIRTSPCDGAKYPYFHWHLTILPKTQIYAGFELGAGLEIITMAPEQAAAYLRKQKS